MKIFVTGGTGFIGSNFINRAIKEGHDILALRRPGSLPRIQMDKEPRWIDGSLDGDFPNIFAGVEVFVHLASHTPNPPYASLDECLYWNVYASLRLARQAKEQGVNKFLVAGSCFEYGKTAERVEEIDVNDPLEPTLSYPISKAAASCAFMGFARESNIKLKILRIFQAYGEGEQETRLWPSLRKAALSGEDFRMTAGEQIRDFVSVYEVANQLTRNLIFENAEAGCPKVHHITSNNPTTIRQFSEFWWSEWGAKGNLLFGAIPYRKGEIMKFVSKRN